MTSVLPGPKQKPDVQDSMAICRCKGEGVNLTGGC